MKEYLATIAEFVSVFWLELLLLLAFYATTYAVTCEIFDRRRETHWLVVEVVLTILAAFLLGQALYSRWLEYNTTV